MFNVIKEGSAPTAYGTVSVYKEDGELLFTLGEADLQDLIKTLTELK